MVQPTTENFPALGNLARLDMWVGANEQAFVHGPSGMAVIEQSGTVVRVNPAMCLLLGVPESELLGQQMVQFVDPAHVKPLTRWLADECGVRSPSLRGETWRHRADGTSVWLVADITRVSTGQSSFCLVTVHDRTTDKLMQEALRRSNEELDALVANAPLAIYKVDPVGRVLLWNAAAEHTFGWSAAEVLGHPLPIIDGDDWDDYLGRHVDSLEGHAKVGEHVQRRHKDGRVLDVSLWTAPVHDAHGETVAVLVVAADVTERQRVEASLAESERRFRTMVQNISDTITVVNASGEIETTTGQVKGILGYPLGYWNGRAMYDLAHPDDLPKARSLFDRVLAAPGEEHHAEFRALHKDGSWAHLDMTAVNLLDDAAVGGIVITTRNTTQSHRNQELLAGQAHILETVAGGASLEETFRELDRTIHELLPGAKVLLLISDGDRLVPRSSTKLDLSLPTVLTHEVLDPQTGRVQAVLAVEPQGQRALGEQEDRVLEMAARLVSITIERHESEQRLIHQGLHDQLTGLANRTLLLDRLAHAVTRAEHGDQQVAVLLIDLDRFKVVNDGLGHGAGDQLLTHFSERLRRLVRPDDTVARFGGDEFVVVSEHGNGPAVVLSIAERLQRTMAEPFNLPDGTDVFLTVSMGMAIGDGADAPTLLRNADAAMYRAKDMGRNRLEVFNATMRLAAVSRLALGNDLQRAVERHEFIVHYQPVVRRDGTLYGAEALVRWQHPERGLLPPADFLAVTEETGLINAVGQQVLDQAVADATRWQRDLGDHPFTLSVNLSASQLDDPDLASKVKHVIDSHGFDPSRLCLELTESVLMDDLDRTHEVLLGLKSLGGIRLAIDDFGTGWSSLTYLHRFPVDQVKIDRSFVADLSLDQGGGHGQAIVAAVLGMAHALDLQVVAEGVEETRQLEALAALGCDLAQGLLFSRPLPADEFAAFLTR